jgi:UDP-GlcNAc:undecaprenyl-phosphate GlcNAc-1-phosphate transferase
MSKVMITVKLIVLPLLAAAGTLCLTPVARKFSTRFGAVDIPGGRKIHKTAVPSSGGVAIFFAFLVAILFFNRTSPEIIGYLIGATVITGIGLLDDIFDITPVAKFFGQILATLIVIYSGVQIGFITNPGQENVFNLGFLALPLTFFWIIGITNAVNFIDGIDGLAAGVTGIASWTLAVVALMFGRYDAGVLAFTLGAAAFAFLPYNFSNDKKIFMGDAGSNFLGYSLAVFSIMGMVKVATAFTMLLPVLVLAVPILDTAFAIIRRLIKHKSMFEPDASHLHHRILRLGYTHKQTSCIIYAISIVLSIIAIISTKLADGYSIFVLIGVALLLILGAWRLGLFKSEK